MQRKIKVFVSFPYNDMYVFVSVTVTESDILFLKIGYKLNNALLSA